MSDASQQNRKQLSDVAVWHILSGYPDGVTDEGDVVASDLPGRDRFEKAALRRVVAELGSLPETSRVHSLVKLAASYLLAGDAETASRYLENARELLAEPAMPVGTPTEGQDSAR